MRWCDLHGFTRECPGFAIHTRGAIASCCCRSENAGVSTAQPSQEICTRCKSLTLHARTVCWWAVRNRALDRTHRHRYNPACGPGCLRASMSSPRPGHSVYIYMSIQKNGTQMHVTPPACGCMSAVDTRGLPIHTLLGFALSPALLS